MQKASNYELYVVAIGCLQDARDVRYFVRCIEVFECKLEQFGHGNEHMRRRLTKNHDFSDSFSEFYSLCEHL